ncbi:MAG TPA: hypothetical protein VM533_17750 [Fimbriiglobus sp.]|jgi:hypothetical protein|nr:hypothetical protein [Fimbriiglobus sp.]
MTSVLALVAVVPAADPGGPSAKVVAVDPPTELAGTVGKLLDKNAVAVADKDGAEMLTVWFRTAVPAKATAEQIANGLTYREIPEGTLIGAVKFAGPFVDFRKQDIAAGVYTLRFLVQPDVGDHMGTAPHTEFLVLSPADKDTDPEPLEPKALIKLSSASTGGDHPGVMLLFPHTAREAGPKLLEKDGVTALAVRRAVENDGAKTTLGFALTVAGYSKSR